MTTLPDLIQSREKLSKRLETIEAALNELQQNVQSVDAEISRIRQQRQSMVGQGRRMFALLQETRRELERQDALIQQCVEEIAAERIGPREGAYVMGRFVIARVRVNGELFTSLVEVISDG